MRDARLVRREELLSKPKRFVREVLSMPDGNTVDWYYLDTPGSVMIVPVTESGELVLVRQYRYNLKQFTLELPAGTIRRGESPRTAAVRELREETGYEPVSHPSDETLGDFYVLPSETNRYLHLLLMPSVRRVGPPTWDDQIEKYFEMSIIEMAFEEALRSVGGELRGIETCAALLLVQNRYPKLVMND